MKYTEVHKQGCVCAFCESERQITSKQLEDRYDVHYCNSITKGKWWRMGGGLLKTVGECKAWIKSYNRPHSIAGMVHIPMEKGLKTEFRIVRLQRTVIETLERQD